VSKRTLAASGYSCLVGAGQGNAPHTRGICDAAGVNRTEIEVKLNRGRADALEMVAAMSDEELRAPRTRSEHDPDSWWSWADHFIHITLIEKNFNAMIRRHLSGEQGMDPAMVDETGQALRPISDIMTYVHELTESWKVKHQDEPLDELVRVSSAVRSDTLKLLSETDDVQLLSTIPGAPWSDGTVGGILAVHTDHWKMHRKWAQEGGVPADGVTA
jgi:hypothetical protein